MFLIVPGDTVNSNIFIIEGRSTESFQLKGIDGVCDFNFYFVELRFFVFNENQILSSFLAWGGS